jgi:signal transduction histidine kinase
VVVEQLSKQFLSAATPSRVAFMMERTVRERLPCESVSVVIRERDGFGAGGSGAGPGESEAGRDEIAATLRASGTVHVVASARSATSGGISVSLPLTFGGKELGVLRVDAKFDGSSLGRDELVLLSTIAAQGALALAHAQACQEIARHRQEQLQALRSERESAAQTVAAEIEHEVLHPMNFFRMLFESQARGAAVSGEQLRLAGLEMERLDRMVTSLRQVALRRLFRSDASVLELCKRAELVLSSSLGRRRVSMQVNPEAMICCDQDRTVQILVNLLSNAIDVTHEVGQIGVIWEQRGAEGLLSVWDTGPGFQVSAEQLFAPWYTTKPRGTGLGLSIANRLASRHGWQLKASRADGRTVFTVKVRPDDVVTLPEQKNADDAVVA